MTRFFLTQEEIVRLCIFAFEHCRGGETLVKLASPIRIAELATAMRDVIGNGQVEVHDNTARVGEKLDAVLLAEEEKSLAKSYGEIIIISHLAKELALDDIQPITDQQVDMDSRRFITDAELESWLRKLCDERSGPGDFWNVGAQTFPVVTGDSTYGVRCYAPE